MSVKDRWLLPQGIEEILPPAAERLEYLRRELLHLYRSWGYELVMPPFIEFLESLLTGVGHDLDLQTFKLTDQLSGRLLGIRADMTPQVARIACRRVHHAVPVRLCYSGTVLHTRHDGLGGNRSPLQIGAELFGHSGIESDIEVLSLMLETLGASGLNDICVDLGHVGIYRSVAARAGLDEQREADFFEALQRKAVVDLEALLRDWQLPDDVAEMLGALSTLHGGKDVLDTAEQVLRPLGSDFQFALERLDQVATAVERRYSEISIHLDLAELRGYHYHTGLVFGAYVEGHGQALAQGGRYDSIAEMFGRSCPATGFTTDLKKVLALVGGDDMDGTLRGIYAPCSDDPALRDMIRNLRESGEQVICELSEPAVTPVELGCDRLLKQQGETWVVVSA
jgi:ATP phosphoribosyltransferase regulatory subunit